MTAHARRVMAAFTVVTLTLGATVALAQTPPPTEMAKYYMVLLRRGPAWTAVATPESRKVSEGHMANIERLTKEGKMVIAGPFNGTSGERALAGIFILRAGTEAEAKTLVESDPAVKAGRFVYEIAEWWGPKSLRY